VQSIDADATGYKGFYYHFLDMISGKRVWNCELSTIDTALLLAGALTAAEYFSGDGADDREIRELADALYRRVDWAWAQSGGSAVTLGWKPKSGFLRYRWQGYNEALLIYLLGLGSPTHPLPAESYPQWTATYQWRRSYDQEVLCAGPLFIHQFPHIWVDFRGIQDEYMRGKHSDYFENSRRPTNLHRQYAIANPAVSRATAKTAGGSRRVTARARRPSASKERSDASLATKLAARPRVPTMGASLRGQSPPPCRSRPRLSRRLCGISRR